MRNYAPTLPRDKSDDIMQEYPSPKRPLTRYASDNASVSSVISVTHDTTALEIAAITTSAVMRWVTTGDTQASIISAADLTENFDHVIPIGTIRRFVVPIESNPQTGSVQGINRELGLFQRVAIKSTGVGSVLLSEF